MLDRRLSDRETLGVVRRVILALVALGTLGSGVELALVGHYEDTNQIIPLVLDAAALLVIAWVARRPGVAALRTLQLVMLLFVGAGIIGIVLHSKANAEFQREMDPSIGTRELVVQVLQATAPPALAPALMVQLGLLGLVYTYRHPALDSRETGGSTN